MWMDSQVDLGQEYARNIIHINWKFKIIFAKILLSALFTIFPSSSIYSYYIIDPFDVRTTSIAEWTP